MIKHLENVEPFIYAVSSSNLSINFYWVINAVKWITCWHFSIAAWHWINSLILQCTLKTSNIGFKYWSNLSIYSMLISFLKKHLLSRIWFWYQLLKYPLFQSYRFIHFWSFSQILEEPPEVIVQQDWRRYS